MFRRPLCRDCVTESTWCTFYCILFLRSLWPAFFGYAVTLDLELLFRALIKRIVGFRHAAKAATDKTGLKIVYGRFNANKPALVQIPRNVFFLTGELINFRHHVAVGGCDISLVFRQSVGDVAPFGLGIDRSQSALSSFHPLGHVSSRSHELRASQLTIWKL